MLRGARVKGQESEIHAIINPLVIDASTQPAASGDGGLSQGPSLARLRNLRNLQRSSAESVNRGAPESGLRAASDGARADERSQDAQKEAECVAQKEQAERVASRPTTWIAQTDRGGGISWAAPAEADPGDGIGFVSSDEDSDSVVSGVAQRPKSRPRRSSPIVLGPYIGPVSYSSPEAEPRVVVVEHHDRRRARVVLLNSSMLQQQLLLGARQLFLGETTPWRSQKEGSLDALSADYILALSQILAQLAHSHIPALSTSTLFPLDPRLDMGEWHVLGGEYGPGSARVDIVGTTQHATNGNNTPPDMRLFEVVVEEAGDHFETVPEENGNASSMPLPPTLDPRLKADILFIQHWGAQFSSLSEPALLDVNTLLAQTLRLRQRLVMRLAKAFAADLHLFLVGLSSARAESASGTLPQPATSSLLVDGAGADEESGRFDEEDRKEPEAPSPIALGLHDEGASSSAEPGFGSVSTTTADVNTLLQTLRLSTESPSTSTADPGTLPQSPSTGMTSLTLGIKSQDSRVNAGTMRSWGRRGHMVQSSHFTGCKSLVMSHGVFIHVTGRKSQGSSFRNTRYH